MTAGARLAAILLCAGCFGGPAHADDVVGDARGEPDETTLRIAARKDGILRALGDWEPEDAAVRSDLIDTIVELPVEERPAIVHALAGLRVSGAPKERVAVLEDVLERLGRHAVEQILSTLATPEASRDDRTLLFWYARSDEHGAGLDNVLAGAAACDDVELVSPALRSHMRQAIAAEVLRTEPDAMELQRMLAPTPPRVRILAIEGLEQSGARISTRALSTLLGADTATDVEILRRLARMPVREVRPFDDVMAKRLPSYLRHDDAGARRFAVMTAMRYRAWVSIDQVVALLEDPDGGVRSAAHRSLIARTGVRLLLDHELWRKWLDDEQAWVKRSRADLDAVAGAEDPGEAVAALRTIRSHPLFGGGSIASIVTASTHEDPIVRVEACAALAALGRFSAIPVLVRRLEDDDERVAKAASQALARLTGVPGATTAEDWHAELLLGR